MNRSELNKTISTFTQDKDKVGQMKKKLIKLRTLNKSMNHGSKGLEMSKKNDDYSNSFGK